MTQYCPSRGTPATEIASRISFIQKAMQDRDLDAVLILQRVDLYYLSGTAQNALLFIPAEGKPLLMVRKYYPRARAESPLEQIFEIGSVREAPRLVRDTYGRMPQRLGLELDVLPYNSTAFYSNLFNGVDIEDCSPVILSARSLKSAWEVGQMERTAALSRDVFERVGKLLRPGITELELALQAEAYAKRLGHEGRLRVRDFMTEGYFQHLLSGESGGTLGLLDAPTSGQGTSPAFPCGAAAKPILKGEPIMADLAMVLNGYHLDETRMYSIGPMPDRARAACEACMEIHDRMIERMKPGAAACELFDYASRLAKSMGLEDAFLGPPGYKVNFIAHGIGLELIEPPFIAARRKDLLEPGMTIALEPKCVYQGEFAAGIESVVQITDSGGVLLSKVPPRIFVC